MRTFFGIVLVTVASLVWLLGPENVQAWGEHKGAQLNPTANIVYGGTKQKPAVVPPPVVGASVTYTVDGPVQVAVPADARLCGGWQNGTAWADNRRAPQVMVYGPTGNSADITLKATTGACS